MAVEAKALDPGSCCGVHRGRARPDHPRAVPCRRADLDGYEDDPVRLFLEPAARRWFGAASLAEGGTRVAERERLDGYGQRHSFPEHGSHRFQQLSRFWNGTRYSLINHLACWNRNK